VLVNPQLAKHGRLPSAAIVRAFVLFPLLAMAHWPLAPSAQPAWALDAVWYQVFPERFRNGDPSNDPTRESLDDPGRAPASWAVTPWTTDWYARAAWERELGPGFYEDGVFLRRFGGDLQGLIDRLDYLDSLGVTALYLNPVFDAPSLHKYDAASMHHIDPHFGPDPAGDLAMMRRETEDPTTWSWTSADSLFLRLLGDAHARDMRVVIDGVYNHTGTQIFAFKNIRQRRGRSRYRDWYVLTREDDPATPADELDWQGWWDYRGLPVFADAPGGEDLAPGPKAYVMAVTSRWMDPNGDGDPADGVDGWRLDVAEEVPAGFWRDWHALVRSVNPEALTIAEIWSDPREFMARAGFDVSMNYHGVAIPLHDFLADGRISARAFVDSVAVRAGRLAPAQAQAMLNLVDSHDTDRIASMLMNPDAANYDRDNGARPSATYDIRAPNSRAATTRMIASPWSGRI
jgi:glycosidase